MYLFVRVPYLFMKTSMNWAPARATEPILWGCEATPHIISFILIGELCLESFVLRALVGELCLESIVLRALF